MDAGARLLDLAGDDKGGACVPLPASIIAAPPLLVVADRMAVQVEGEKLAPTVILEFVNFVFWFIFFFRCAIKYR
jgi:hypothetical protein